MTKDKRLELNELSTKAFGGPLKWSKLLKKGYVTNQIEIMKDGTERKYKGTKFLSLDELVTTMNDMILKKEQEEAAKKEVNNEQTKSQD